MGLDLEHQEEIEKLIQSYPFDFVIGSIHVIHHTEFYYGEFFKGKTKEEAHREFFEEKSNVIEIIPMASMFTLRLLLTNPLKTVWIILFVMVLTKIKQWIMQNTKILLMKSLKH